MTSLERLAEQHQCDLCGARVNQRCPGPRPHPERLRQAERTAARLAEARATADA